MPHLGRARPGNGDGMRLAAESGRKGVASTHDHFAVRRGPTARRRQGRALSCDWHPATTQVGNKAMRAAACDPIPIVVCGWPRSHLLSSLFAVQRLAGWSRDPSSMGLRRSSIHGSVHLARPRRRWRWMLSKQSSVRARALVQHGARVPDHTWMVCRGSCFSPSRRGAACWPKFWGVKERARHGLGLARVSSGGLGLRCACRGVGGDVPGPWPCHRHARITQRRRVGELEPELYFLAVSGQFHDLVKRRKNRLRGSRVPSGGAPGRAHPVGNAQRARRRLAGSHGALSVRTMVVSDQ